MVSLLAVGQSSASSQHLPNGCGSSAAMQATAAATLGRPHPITVSYLCGIASSPTFDHTPTYAVHYTCL